MFGSCMHPVAVLNAAFSECMTCSLLMLVGDAIGHTEDVYSRAGLITALYVAMSVYFCLPHSVLCCLLLGSDCSYILQGLV